MHRVTVEVNNHKYGIICPSDEVQKIQYLSEIFNQRLRKLNVNFKKFSHSHAFLTLGLILLDEIQELNAQRNSDTTDCKLLTSVDKAEELNDFLKNLSCCIERIKRSLAKLENYYQPETSVPLTP